MEERKEYLKIEKIIGEIVKEIARVLEGYGFRLVEWKKEGNIRWGRARWSSDLA